ncbi:hypothetical protein EDC04DRAFT_2893875 [Pisolithus marmoratus]|nr:hypothetical protein EDC04DRAFT_2893875 [Pisolithus marmoratus]
MELDELTPIPPEDCGISEGIDEAEDKLKKATSTSRSKPKPSPEFVDSSKDSMEFSGSNDGSDIDGSRDDDDIDPDNSSSCQQHWPLPFSAQWVNYILVGLNLRCAVPHSAAAPHWQTPAKAAQLMVGKDVVPLPPPNKHEQECQATEASQSEDLIPHDEDAQEHLSTLHQSPGPTSPPCGQECPPNSPGDTSMQVDCAADPSRHSQSLGASQCPSVPLSYAMDCEAESEALLVLSLESSPKWFHMAFNFV